MIKELTAKHVVTLMMFAAYAATNLFYWLALAEPGIAMATTVLILALYLPASHVLTQ